MKCPLGYHERKHDDVGCPYMWETMMRMYFQWRIHDAVQHDAVQNVMKCLLDAPTCKKIQWGCPLWCIPPRIPPHERKHDKELYRLTYMQENEMKCFLAAQNMWPLRAPMCVRGCPFYFFTPQAAGVHCIWCLLLRNFLIVSFFLDHDLSTKSNQIICLTCDCTWPIKLILILIRKPGSLTHGWKEKKNKEKTRKEGKGVRTWSRH